MIVMSFVPLLGDMDSIKKRENQVRIKIDYSNVQRRMVVEDTTAVYSLVNLYPVHPPPGPLYNKQSLKFSFGVICVEIET